MNSNVHLLTKEMGDPVQKLDAEQRAFFERVAEAAFSNPFSRERDELDYRIAGLPGPVSDAMLMAKLQQAIGLQLEKLKQNGRLTLQAFTVRDRPLLESAYLFQLFNDYQSAFDRFIQDQAQAGDEPIPLPFAREILQKLTETGFQERQSATYLALFYQLRRAFYFIQREISGASPSMVQLRMHLWNTIFTFRPEWYLNYLCEKMEDFSTLLLGETGTGKSAAAKAIGCSGYIPFDLKTLRYKESFTRSFQAINLSQFPAGLLESELFGHKKGAFTGAIQNHEGLLARCSAHGAVFIDEIGDIDPPTQVKLLNVLQERSFSPVGGHEKIKFQGRVIAATHQDLDQLRMKGLFRHDFYYRLCSDVIILPPLRQRLAENPGELGVILERLVKKAIGETSRALIEKIEGRILASLPKNYPWPGNVRELEQCVRRICLTGRYAGDIDFKAAEKQNGFIEQVAQGTLSAQALLSGYCQQLYERFGTYEEVARVTGLDRRTVKKHCTPQNNS